jgi:hypothetical protein
MGWVRSLVLDQVRSNLKNVIFSVLAAVRLQTALVAVNVVLVSVGEAQYAYKALLPSPTAAWTDIEGVEDLRNVAAGWLAACIPRCTLAVTLPASAAAARRPAAQPVPGRLRVRLPAHPAPMPPNLHVQPCAS